MVDRGRSSLVVSVRAAPRMSDGGAETRKDRIMMDEFLTVQEAAVYLKTTPGTICKWCRSGVLPAIKLGKVWRISRSELGRQLTPVVESWAGQTDAPALATNGKVGVS